jgi:ATP-binding cassette subfamily B multidrug efflux pump
MIRKLAPYVKKYLTPTLLTPLLVIGEVILEIFIPLIMSKIVDIGIQNRDIAYVVKMGLLMILMALLSLGCGAGAARTGAKAAMGFGSELRRALFNKVQDFSFANIDKYSTPSLITRLTTDVNTIQFVFMMVIRIMVRAPFMLISATIMAFSINSSLVTIFLVALPVLALTLAIVAVVAFPRFSVMLKKYDKLNASVQENLIAIRVVKAFVRSDHEKAKFKAANDDNMQASINADKVLVWNMPIMQLAMYSCIIAALWFGGNMIVVGTMQTGELIGFISYISQVLMSLMMIAQIFIGFVMSRASVARVVEVLDQQIDITDAHVNEEVVPEDGSISFRGVSFRYDKSAESNTLEQINLEIRSGEMIGIIGGTGSAKTTLVQMIPRLYDVDEGEVIVGGHDVRDYRLRELRDNVSMVLQNNVLFSGTIRENLKWGNPDATDEQIVEACKAAQAHEFVMSFSDGYDTDLGQGGVNVSGGQKQRLCIARALLKQPKIIILDDSTSAVDTATDARIRQAFREELAGTTTLIIAQRVSSVMDADHIIVMNEGKIDAIGTHEELMESNEIYREVYLSQQKGVA